MSNIPHVHFVYPFHIDDVFLRIGNVDEYWDKFVYGRDVWILQTFALIRKKCNFTITLGKNVKSRCVNIIHGGNYGRIKSKEPFYFVNLVSDKVRVPWVHYEVVQNKIQEGWKSIYIPHWPQPGLIKRNRERKQVVNIAYLGAEEQNILRMHQISKDLNLLGFHYIEMNRKCWNNYSEIDISLAIRDFSSGNKFSNKPSSKLINSWWAEVPLIAGSDSAYSQIGKAGENYIIVDSYKQLLDTIKMLAQRKDYFLNIIQNGIKEREKYSRAAITAHWIDILEKKIIPDFLRWQELRPEFRLLDSLKRRFMRGVSIFEGY